MIATLVAPFWSFKSLIPNHVELFNCEEDYEEEALIRLVADTYL